MLSVSLSYPILNLFITSSVNFLLYIYGCIYAKSNNLFSSIMEESLDFVFISNSGIQKVFSIILLSNLSINHSLANSSLIPKTNPTTLYNGSASPQVKQCKKPGSIFPS